jgi:transcription elongation GreA/GreB family factor
MDKRSAIGAIIKELERQKLELENGLKSAKQAAKDSPSAMESHSDTTRNQMQILGDNIKRMIEEKGKALDSLKKIMDSSEGVFDSVQDGAVIETEGEKNEKHFYVIVPEGGAGATIDQNGVPITSITLKTPLGTALAGKKTGDTAIVQNKNGDRKIKILGIF